MRARGKWNYINPDMLTRQIDETEKAERQAREKAEAGMSFRQEAENPTESAILQRLDKTANPTVDNTQLRQDAIVAQHKKIREIEDEYLNKWQKEMRSTIQGIREFKDWRENDKLLAEQARLQAEIAKLSGVRVK